MALWFFMPAMLPNTAAAIFGGGTALDFGRSWRGRRLLGDGKTWRGLAVGIISGLLLGYLEAFIASATDLPIRQVFAPAITSLPILLCLTAGSMGGDIAAAFFKRRAGLARGAKVPLLDQYDFVAGAIVVAGIFQTGKVNAFLLSGDAFGLILVIVVVYPLHRLINYIGFRKGMKDVPW